MDWVGLKFSYRDKVAVASTYGKQYEQEAQLLLGDRATRKHAKIAEMDVEMTT